MGNARSFLLQLGFPGRVINIPMCVSMIIDESVFCPFNPNVKGLSKTKDPKGTDIIAAANPIISTTCASRIPLLPCSGQRIIEIPNHMRSSNHPTKDARKLVFPAFSHNLKIALKRKARRKGEGAKIKARPLNCAMHIENYTICTTLVAPHCCTK